MGSEKVVQITFASLFTYSEWARLFIAYRRKVSMKFRNYREEDYQALCDFLIEINKYNKNHINWNWARFEWMYEHPEFDKSSKHLIGLWENDGEIVGAAIYDMYFGEAFCGVLPEYDSIFPEILEYTYNELKDDSGIGIAICDDNIREIETATKNGFTIADQTESIMRFDLNKSFSAELPNEFQFYELDPVEEPYEFQWLLWQGFDHGEDKAEFEREDEIIPQARKHLNKKLSVAAVNKEGEKVAYCCLWYCDKTDYVYVEPVCTIPSYRGKGISKAVIYEALNRAKALGAKQAYVISDMEYYEKLGFEKDVHFTFYWRTNE